MLINIDTIHLRANVYKQHVKERNTRENVGQHSEETKVRSEQHICRALFSLGELFGDSRRYFKYMTDERKKGEEVEEGRRLTDNLRG